MLIWLSGIDNHKWAPNENYAREQMELFTLGVDAGYTEDDVREQARALTGWRADWDDNVGYVNFRFDPSYHDNGNKTIFGQTGTVRLGGLERALPRAPRPRGLPDRQALGLLHPGPDPAQDPQAAADALREEEPRDPAAGRDDPHAPAPVRRAADDQAADRADRRHAEGAPQGDRERGVDLDRRERRPAAVPAAERRRLGRGPLARHRPDRRALGRRRATRATRSRSTRRTTARPSRRGRRSRRRSTGGATRRSRSRPTMSSCGSRRASRRSPARTGRRGPTGRCGRWRCGC